MVSEQDGPDRCIAHTHAAHLGKSWCGRSVSGEWTFQDIDHAAYNQVQFQSASVCEACIAAIVRCLPEPGTEPPGWGS